MAKRWIVPHDIEPDLADPRCVAWMEANAECELVEVESGSDDEDVVEVEKRDPLVALAVNPANKGRENLYSPRGPQANYYNGRTGGGRCTASLRRRWLTKKQDPARNRSAGNGVECGLILSPQRSCTN